MAFRSIATTQGLGGFPATLNEPAGYQPHDRLVVVFCDDSSPVTATALSPGWVALGTSIGFGNDTQTLALFELKDAQGTGVDGFSFTSNGPVTESVWFVIAFSGRDNSASVTFVTPASDSTDSPSPRTLTGGSGTALAGDDLLWVGEMDSELAVDTWTFSTPTGFTERVEVANANWVSAAVSTKDNVSAGAFGTVASTATQTGGGGVDGRGWAQFVVAIPAAPTGILCQQESEDSIAVTDTVATSMSINLSIDANVTKVYF